VATKNEHRDQQVNTDELRRLTEQTARLAAAVVVKSEMTRSERSMTPSQ
jgi:hypothetical protein